jgi:hypothetical protein
MSEEAASSLTFATNSDTIAPPSMSILRIIGVVFGLMLLVVGGFMALFSAFLSPSAPDNDRAFVTIFFLGTAVLGFFIARRASPRVLGNFSASPASFIRSTLRPDSLRRPLVMAIWTLVVATVLLAVAPRGGVRTLIAFGAFLIYLVAAMVSLVAFPGWWRRALLTLLLGPVVMFGLALTAEAFEKNVVGEGGLAFAGVLMWSWAIIPITGLGRLLFARPAPAPPHPPASEPHQSA